MMKGMERKKLTMAPATALNVGMGRMPRAE